MYTYCEQCGCRQPNGDSRKHYVGCVFAPKNAILGLRRVNQDEIDRKLDLRDNMKIALEQAHKKIKDLQNANDTLREIVLDLQDFMEEDDEL